jgi:hypothetical protein
MMRETVVYLVLSMEGSRLRVERMTKTPPSLYRHELAIKQRVRLDDEVFRNKIPEVTLNIEGAQLIAAEFEPEVAVDDAPPPAKDEE